jgi:fumarate reductase flavoprotein subunit
MSAKKCLPVTAACFIAAALSLGCSTPKTYDVVVVGSGAAGLSAAIEAASAGANVAVLEKLPMVGGSTVLSGGIVYSTASSIMKEAGIEDSVDALVSYWSDRADGKADPAKLRFVAERSGANVDWLVGLGVKFGKPYPTGTSSVPRGVSTSDGGVGIVGPLKAAADAKKVEFFMETSAVKLVAKNGVVTGVEAVTAAGKKLVFSAKAVVLATGGFDRNKELMAKYAPTEGADITFVGVGNTGDGLSMATALGAQVVGNGGAIGLRAVPGEPTFETPVSMLVWYPYLYVNKEGARFANEAADYPLFHAAINAQTDKSSFQIYDAQTYNELLEKAIEKGQAFKADSIESLAAAAGIESANFAATVAAYNKAVAAGVDKEFGKDLKGQPPVAKAPFYALKVNAATIGTMVGLKTDLDTRVLGADDKPIGGLFAAGEVANGDFFNMIYPASGTSIQMSVTFGRIAGQQAAALK